MLKMRIQFSKLDEVRFISHLDLMRTISRALRRAKVPIGLSQGFNPHFLISMASALPVGMTSSAEYMDLEFSDKITVDEFMDKIKLQMPSGLELIKGEIIPLNVESLMSQINCAVYLIRLKTDLKKEGIEDIIREFYNQNQILITRLKKDKVKTVDIKPMLKKVEVFEHIGEIILKVKVQTGSKGNVRPEEVMAALSEYNRSIEKVPLTFMHRQGLYIEKDGRLFTPFELV